MVPLERIQMLDQDKYSTSEGTESRLPDVGQPIAQDFSCWV
jgi:hypothetical protein